MKIIDLHGLTENEAILKIDSALYDFENNDHINELEIITGKGDVLTFVCEEILQKKGYDWHHENGNKGSYIIKKY